MKTGLLVFFLFFNFIFIPSVKAKTSLGNIRAFIDKDYNEFVTELNFSESIDLSKIKLNHQKSKIEIQIPGIKTEKKSAKLNIGDAEVNSIQVQRTKKYVTIGLLFNKKIDGNDFEGYTRLEKDGKLVRISLKRHSYIALQNQIKKNDLTPTSLSFEGDEKVSLGRSLATKAKTNSKDEIPSKRQDLEKKSESEIPVLSKVSKKEKSQGGSLLSRSVMSLGVLAGFAIGLLFFLKWWSKNHKPNETTNKIRVLTQHHLGPKKSLAIVRVAGEAILIGVTDHSINHIKTLSLLDDEIPESVPRHFQTELNENFQENDQENLQEDFTYGDSIKKTIAKRLKGLRS